jgi:flagellar basal-body rod modification protein FlgD
MATNVQNQFQIPSPFSYKGKKEFTTELDQNAFMKLMLEQLKHQDPLSPMDNQQFVQQTSIMTMVERLTRMQQLMEESNSSLLNIREYESLIGKTATYEKESQDELTGETFRETKTGTISAVKMTNGKIYFTIGDDLVARDKISGLESKGMTNDSLMDNTLKYAQLVGKRVTYLDTEVIDADGKPETTNDQISKSVEKTGLVTGFAVKNGTVEFQLDNGKKLGLDELIGMQLVPENIPMDATLKYTQLIGYQVTYLEKEVTADGSSVEVEKTGLIKAVSMKNGLIEFLLDNDKKIKLSDIIGFEAK